MRPCSALNCNLTFNSSSAPPGTGRRPATAEKMQIIEALGKLRAAKLLIGIRGAPPADLTAVAEVVLAISGLMQSVPEISEIDINPLTVHAKGQGATALDALIVVG